MRAWNPAFFLAGFESASHRRRDGVQLDLLQATQHDRWAAHDYRQCASLGITAVRDALRWHRIEAASGSYDWSSWLPMLEAAEVAGVRVAWTLLHYGTPSHLHLSDAHFAAQFARFAAAAARLHRDVTGRALVACPVNEISFHAWAIDAGYFTGCGMFVSQVAKQQLVRAALCAVQAMREADPECVLVWSEPLIHVAPHHHDVQHKRCAEAHRLAQFEAYDMLTGDTLPELGGSPDVVDAIGLNFYPHNQWYFEGSTIPLGHHEYRPLADMLTEVHRRYQRPVWLAETGAEGSARAAWLHYVCDEVRTAEQRGVPIEGVCLYPITCYPGWDNDRPVQTGLLSDADGQGTRSVYAPMLLELERQRALRPLSRKPRDTQCPAPARS